MTHDEIKTLLLDAFVGRVYQALGVKPTAPVTSHIKASAIFMPDPTGEPRLSDICDPVTLKHFANAQAFGEHLRSDPDFNPPRPVNNGEPAPPRHVHQDNLAQERVSLADIASGRVIVDMYEPEKIEAKEGEVSLHDQRRLNANIEKIARGEVRVV